MKITVEQLKQLIREQVEESKKSKESKESIDLYNKRVALETANEVIELMLAIRDKLPDVFQNDAEWEKASHRLAMVEELVAGKQRELQTDPMEQAQMMRWPRGWR